MNENEATEWRVASPSLNAAAWKSLSLLLLPPLCLMVMLGSYVLLSVLTIVITHARDFNSLFDIDSLLSLLISTFNFTKEKESLARRNEILTTTHLRQPILAPSTFAVPTAMHFYQHGCSKPWDYVRLTW